MGYVRIGRVKSVQDLDGELIKVNRDIHKSKRVNIVLGILHILGNSLITLLRADKILAMDNDPFARRKGICLLESSPRSLRCGGGRDKLHKSCCYGPNNCVKKQMVPSEPENMIWIRGGGINIR